MHYFWIYWIIIAILAYATVHFWGKAKAREEKAELYKGNYLTAKDAWAAQSNAIREKNIECNRWQRECIKLQRTCKKLEKILKIK